MWWTYLLNAPMSTWATTCMCLWHIFKLVLLFSHYLYYAITWFVNHVPTNVCIFQFSFKNASQCVSGTTPVFDLFHHNLFQMSSQCGLKVGLVRDKCGKDVPISVWSGLPCNPNFTVGVPESSWQVPPQSRRMSRNAGGCVPLAAGAAGALAGGAGGAGAGGLRARFLWELCSQ